MRDLDVPIAPRTLSDILAQGLDTISHDVVQTIQPLLPHGSYMVAMLEITPTYVKRAERVSSIGPGIDYYWW